MPKSVKILDFDIETRPITYLGSDFTTADITVMAWSWGSEGDKEPEVTALSQTKQDFTRNRMLKEFVRVYDEADMVTGHYITGFDLPTINGALLEAGLEPLGPKLVCDTKTHLVSRKGISASQESLGAMLGLEHQKYQMDQHKWRKANRLDPWGIAVAVERCVADVLEHMELRKRLVELDWLKPPTLWRGSNRAKGYVP